MPKTESLNDFAPMCETLQRFRIGTIRDIIAESKADSLSKKEIRNQVQAYCIEKELPVSEVTIDMDYDVESIVVKTKDTAYYFKI